MGRMIDEFMAAGFSGITNVPTAGLYDGDFRRHIDATGLGYPKEVELIAACRARDVFTLAYAFSPAEARAMAEAGADIIGVHVGLTSGGWIGAEETLELDAACAATQAMLEAAKAGRPTSSSWPTAARSRIRRRSPASSRRPTSSATSGPRRSSASRSSARSPASWGSSRRSGRGHRRAEAESAGRRAHARPGRST